MVVFCSRGLLALTFLPFTAFLHVANAEPSGPNFVVIMADDMGYGDLGCYGGQSCRTPHLDRMAADGLRFTDFHSSGCVCSPTRAGLLTGRYQQRAGVDGVIYAALNRNRHHGLQRDEVTFTEILRQAGYMTGIAGKWHLGYESQYNPIHHGFDEFHGYVSGNVDFHTHIDGAGFFDWWHQDNRVREEGYSTHLITKHACAFIERAAELQKPFCLYVAHEAPHDPYQGPGDPPVRLPDKPGLQYNHREPAHAARAYAEMVHEMDDGVGRILETLEQKNLVANTLVLFFSDNGATGPGSCGSLYGMKGTLWEGGHRVPAIAWWPGRIRPGVCKKLTCTLDVMPTLLDLAELEPQADSPMDGKSLVRQLERRDDQEKSRILFWQYQKSASMRAGQWKLIVNGASPPRTPQKRPWIRFERLLDNRYSVALFDLSADPGERRNLAATLPERVRSMTMTLEAWQRDVNTGATAQPEKQE